MCWGLPQWRILPQEESWGRLGRLWTIGYFVNFFAPSEAILCFELWYKILSLSIFPTLLIYTFHYLHFCRLWLSLQFHPTLHSFIYQVPFSLFPVYILSVTIHTDSFLFFPHLLHSDSYLSHLWLITPTLTPLWLIYPYCTFTIYTARYPPVTLAWSYSNIPEF